MSSGMMLGQVENKVLAKVGTDEITSEYFANRFEFMPHLNYSDSNIDTLKKEFLYSIIAEKLWSLEAAELEMDTIETIRLSLRSLKKLFVNDELYKQEVQSKIILSGEEIAKGLACVTRILEINIVASSDSQKIWSFYKSLLNKGDFDSLLTTISFPNKISEVKFGSLEDEYIEDILFSLKLNEFTKPLNSKGNWFIFKLVDDKRDQSIDLTKDYARNIVVKSLTDRKSQKIGREFLNSILGGRSITADRKIFDVFYEILKTVIKERTGKTESDTSLNIQLLGTDLLKTLSKLDNENLNKTFTVVDNDSLTIKDYAFYLMYQKINFKSLKPYDSKIILNMAVRQFIESEMIYNEGLKRNLDKLLSVKNDLQLWKDYYLSEIFMKSYADSIKVTDDEVEKVIDEKSKLLNVGLQVNIIEILIDKIDDAEKILNELNDGKDFKAIASVYNKREWTKKSNGEWGFFSVSLAGEIGRIAAGMNIGDVYGPIKVDEGYSIFKLIDKRNSKNNIAILTDNEDRKFARLKLALQKMDKLLNEKTISLANKYKINVNDHLLKQLEVSNLNTFTYRFIGFGGKIAAFPITVPMYEWFEQYQNIKEIP
jgi:parvulin-like peptidyl-prolyl isomerase